MDEKTDIIFKEIRDIVDVLEKQDRLTDIQRETDGLFKINVKKMKYSKRQYCFGRKVAKKTFEFLRGWI